METQPDGTVQMVQQPIYLPRGKKPFVLSEDDVCYYEYMTGTGFATKLCLDENGKVVDSWTSGKEAHIIKELVVGQKYTLTETNPADGFVTAESITFTVEDTAEAQKIEMKDDVTKVEISKTDISGKELPRAKLTILD